MFAALQPETKSADASSSAKKRILIIDDEAPIRIVVKACLEISGIWEVWVAASGLEGLETIKTEQFDVILLDLIMPEMDGFTFLRNLRAYPSTNCIPVVLLTATAHLVNAKQAEQLGVVGIIAKPFQPLRLTSQILEALQAS